MIWNIKFIKARQLFLLLSLSMFMITTVVFGKNAPEKPLVNVQQHTSIDCSKRASYQWGQVSMANILYHCIPKGWEDFFYNPNTRTEIENLSNQLDTFYEANKGNITFGPSPGLVFEAFYATMPQNMKAVILGLDPRVPQATGLAFSIASSESTDRVGSIQRMLLEAQNEKICVDPLNGDVSRWATAQGVFLLNAALTFAIGNCRLATATKIKCTTERGPIHQQRLWQPIMHRLFSFLNKTAPPIAYIAWGNAAKSLVYNNVDLKKNGLIHGPHPSPINKYGKKFFCRGYFRCANQFLTTNKRKAIDWNLKNHCNTFPKPCRYQWTKPHAPIPKTGLRSFCDGDFCEPIDCSIYFK